MKLNREALVLSKSLEDLRKLGTIEEIEKFINEETKPFKVELKNWKDTLHAVIVLKENWLSFGSTPFVNQEKEYIFYLTKIEGKSRKKLLGITDEMYSNSSKAREWYSQIAKIVHPDKTSSNNSEAFVVLNKIYENMTDYDIDSEYGEDYK